MSAGDDPFSRLLYPMLASQPQVDDRVLAELSRAPLDKAGESERLREQVLEAQGEELVACARAIAAAVRRGGRVLAFGNGGSATAAADMVAELMAPPPPQRPIPALCLAAGAAVLTAVANDVSFDDVVVRQVLALGRVGDVLVVVSTSGSSENLVRGLQTAARRGMRTVALCGYDGGRVAREAPLDHCFVVRSSSVHRIQEVQATLHHLLVELVRRDLVEEPACA
jgi:D-sedoheptulose 7-phosphate isomerase